MRRRQYRRRVAKPLEGIYATPDRRVLRIRHCKAEGWYAHEGSFSRGGSLEWTYLGQVRLDGARLLDLDPDYPLTCGCGAPASGKHVIAKRILCGGCMSDHLRKVCA